MHAIQAAAEHPKRVQRIGAAAHHQVCRVKIHTKVVKPGFAHQLQKRDRKLLAGFKQEALTALCQRLPDQANALHDFHVVCVERIVREIPDMRNDVAHAQ